MKEYKIEGWYRYGDNEKDYEFETIQAESAEIAMKNFLEIYRGVTFFKLLVN